MVRLVCILAILLFSASVSAHPGKTDRRGGHKCWKKCGEWNLEYGEYHLHDKNWKPIRTDAKGNPLQQAQTEPPPFDEQQRRIDPIAAEEKTQAAAPPGTPEEGVDKPVAPEKIGRNQTTVVTVPEEGFLSLDTALLFALALFLLMVLILLRKRREKE